MALDEPRQDDQVIESMGVKVLVDPGSAQHLDGIQVDYVDSMMGGGFKITNPNATSSCGCGSSFRTAKDSGSPKECGCS